MQRVLLFTALAAVLSLAFGCSGQPEPTGDGGGTDSTGRDVDKHELPYETAGEPRPEVGEPATAKDQKFIYLQRGNAGKRNAVFLELVPIKYRPAVYILEHSQEL